MRYWSGFFTGVVFVLVAGMMVFASQVRPTLSAMYLELGKVQLPEATLLVIHPAWAWGAPASVIGVTLLANFTNRERPAQPILLGACALASVVIAAFTIWASYLPIWQVAGPIT